MFEEKFTRKKPIAAKLLAFGFSAQGDSLHYCTPIVGGQLALHVSVDAAGHLSEHVVDSAFGDPYPLYRDTSISGDFVGRVRTECEAALEEIARCCFEPAVFCSPQSLELIDYVRLTYARELEFLWGDKFPDNAVWRRPDSQKWFALMFRISRRKLGLDSDEVVEAIDLRMRPEEMPSALDGRSILPGWHLNKKTWCAIILDSSLPTPEICRRIDSSFSLAAKHL